MKMTEAHVAKEREDVMRRLYAVVTSIKPDASGFATDDDGAVTEALIAGLVENLQQKKACRTCGHEQTDYWYWKITPAGKLFRDAFAAHLRELVK